MPDDAPVMTTTCSLNLFSFTPIDSPFEPGPELEN
jgi:hypothetical protein